jgi:molecular chaperone GrpE (heat shock protein)
LQLALRHHPDTSADQSSNPDTFVKIREAFEQIKKDFAKQGDGKGITSSWLTEEEFDAWFHEETGQKMDAATRREVMHVYRSGLTRTE